MKIMEARQLLFDYSYDKIELDKKTLHTAIQKILWALEILENVRREVKVLKNDWGKER